MRFVEGSLIIHFETINEQGQWAKRTTGNWLPTAEGWAAAQQRINEHKRRADRRNSKVHIIFKTTSEPVDSLEMAQAYLASEWTTVDDGDGLARHADEQLRLGLDEARRLLDVQRVELDEARRLLDVQRVDLDRLREAVSERAETIRRLQLEVDRVTKLAQDRDDRIFKAQQALDEPL